MHYFSDVQKIQDGIGDKLAVFICMMARTIAGIIIGFIFAWQLTLVILAVTPLMALSAGLLMKVNILGLFVKYLF